MQNLLGVILCGGESKRMGTDKGLIQQDGKTWAQIVANKIPALGLPVVISINDRQVEDYGRIFSSDHLVVDNVDINGPLRGLLTVHQSFPQSDILLLACDLIDMDTDTIQNLISVAKADENYEFYVYENHGLAEPFCAIYTSKGLKSVYDKALQHGLTQNSFQSVLANGKTKRIVLNNPDPFRNYNTMPGHHKF
ncbi:molybdenum cofactor guanylyltransferase [Chitinophagaceae bacterium LB-8]|uniref:Molybdenum cofactor guanylyltransferase n=1 Tax=Paraflavisolibacter caeni TaxID=2982496 RepID=A0A9X2XXJ5_9BACT|nr:molybdenum cofactor guanylyltransferase [Paraflavisolibacter caeni]MCU7550780.1 molybdenum cofactor guanylyltransferase [Paraflavisolibacter caeni]